MSNLIVTVPDEILAFMGGLSGLRHLGYLCRTSRAAQAILLLPSWAAWVMAAQQVWGSFESWDKLRNSAETPAQFAKRMLFPWVQAPVFLNLGLPDIQKLRSSERPDAKDRRAWRIRLDRANRLEITAQVVNERHNYFWSDNVGTSEEVNVKWFLPAGPLTRATVADLTDAELGRWDRFLTAYTFLWREGETCHRLQFEGAHRSCWRMHAGVVVATCRTVSDHEAVVALGFFGARKRRLLHVHFVPEEIVATREIFVARPGEMWVLERWGDPESRLVYFGPRVDGPQVEISE